MLKVNTEDYIRELKFLAHQLQDKHKDIFSRIESPVLLTIQLPDDGFVNFLIDSQGINHQENPPDVRDRIIISYKDLLKLIEKPSKIIRYVLEGRVKIYGDYKRILNTLQEVL